MAIASYFFSIPSHGFRCAVCVSLLNACSANTSTLRFYTCFFSVENKRLVMIETQLTDGWIQMLTWSSGLQAGLGFISRLKKLGITALWVQCYLLLWLEIPHSHVSMFPVTCLHLLRHCAETTLYYYFLTDCFSGFHTLYTNRCLLFLLVPTKCMLPATVDIDKCLLSWLKW